MAKRNKATGRRMKNALKNVVKGGQDQKSLDVKVDLTIDLVKEAANAELDGSDVELQAAPLQIDLSQVEAGKGVESENPAEMRADGVTEGVNADFNNYDVDLQAAFPQVDESEVQASRGTESEYLEEMRVDDSNADVKLAAPPVEAEDFKDADIQNAMDVKMDGVNHAPDVDLDNIDDILAAAPEVEPSEAEYAKGTDKQNAMDMKVDRVKEAINADRKDSDTGRQATVLQVELSEPEVALNGKSRRRKAKKARDALKKPSKFRNLSAEAKVSTGSVSMNILDNLSTKEEKSVEVDVFNVDLSSQDLSSASREPYKISKRSLPSEEVMKVGDARLLAPMEIAATSSDVRCQAMVIYKPSINHHKHEARTVEKRNESVDVPEVHLTSQELLNTSGMARVAEEWLPTGASAVNLGDITKPAAPVETTSLNVQTSQEINLNESLIAKLSGIENGCVADGKGSEDKDKAEDADISDMNHFSQNLSSASRYPEYPKECLPAERGAANFEIFATSSAHVKTATSEFASLELADNCKNFSLCDHSAPTTAGTSRCKNSDETVTKGKSLDPDADMEIFEASADSVTPTTLAQDTLASSFTPTPIFAPTHSVPTPSTLSTLPLDESANGGTPLSKDNADGISSSTYRTSDNLDMGPVNAMVTGTSINGKAERGNGNPCSHAAVDVEIYTVPVPSNFDIFSSSTIISSAPLNTVPCLIESERELLSGKQRRRREKKARNALKKAADNGEYNLCDVESSPSSTHSSSKVACSPPHDIPLGDSVHDATQASFSETNVATSTSLTQSCSETSADFGADISDNRDVSSLITSGQTSQANQHAVPSTPSSSDVNVCRSQNHPLQDKLEEPMESGVNGYGQRDTNQRASLPLHESSMTLLCRSVSGASVQPQEADATEGTANVEDISHAQIMLKFTQIFPLKLEESFYNVLETNGYTVESISIKRCCRQAKRNLSLRFECCIKEHVSLRTVIRPGKFSTAPLLTQAVLNELLSDLLRDNSIPPEQFDGSNGMAFI